MFPKLYETMKRVPLRMQDSIGEPASDHLLNIHTHAGFEAPNDSLIADSVRNDAAGLGGFADLTCIAEKVSKSKIARPSGSLSLRNADASHGVSHRRFDLSARPTIPRISTALNQLGRPGKRFFQKCIYKAHPMHLAVFQFVYLGHFPEGETA